MISISVYAKVRYWNHLKVLLTWVIYLSLVSSKSTWSTKGHLISKCQFGVFNFSQKMNENKSTWGIIVLKSIFFVRILGELKIPKSPFEINWPLKLDAPLDIYTIPWKIVGKKSIATNNVLTFLTQLYNWNFLFLKVS